MRSVPNTKPTLSQKSVKPCLRTAIPNIFQTREGHIYTLQNLHFVILGVINIIFDIIVLVLNSKDSDEISWKIYLFTLSLTFTLIPANLTLFFFSRKQKKMKKFFQKVHSVQSSINCVLLVERALATEKWLDVFEITNLFCACLFTINVELLHQRKYKKKKYKMILFAILAAYLIIRAFLVNNLTLLIFLIPLGSRALADCLSLITDFKQFYDDEALGDGFPDQFISMSETKINTAKDKNFPYLSQALISDRAIATPNSEFLFIEKIFSLTSEGFVVYSAQHDQAPLYSTKFLENGPSSRITHLMKTSLFVTPIIKQDDKFHHLLPDYSVSKGASKNNRFNQSLESEEEIRKKQIPTNDKILKKEDDRAMNESDYLSSNYSSFIHEPLWDTIQKLKESVLKENRAKDPPISSDRKFGTENFMSFHAKDSFKVLKKCNFLVSLKKNVNSLVEIDFERKRLFDVEIIFFEKGKEDIDLSNLLDLYFLVIFRGVENWNIIEKLQKEIENFKAQFICSISHELKTPLNCTINMLELLELDFVSRKEENESILIKLRAALQNSKILVCNINDVLDYSDLLSNKFFVRPSKFSLKSLLNNSLELISSASKERGNILRLEYDSSICETIISDEGRLSQIILNLLTNANKYTSNGLITIQAKLFGDRDVKISVSDTGTGMNPNMIKKIGLLGLSKSSKLVGLGLTIANYIASVLGPVDKKGIFVTSKLGRGSVFTIFVENIRESLLKISTLSSFNGKMGTFEHLNLNNLFTHYSKLKRSSSSVFNRSFSEKSDEGEEQLDQYGVPEVSLSKSRNEENFNNISEMCNEEELKTENEAGGTVQGLMKALGHPLGMQLLKEKDHLLHSVGSNDKNIDVENKLLRQLSEKQKTTKNIKRERVNGQKIDFQRLFPVPKSLGKLLKKLKSSDSHNNSEESGRKRTPAEELSKAISMNYSQSLKKKQSFSKSGNRSDPAENTHRSVALGLSLNSNHRKSVNTRPIEERTKVSEEGINANLKDRGPEPKLILKTLPQILSELRIQKSCTCSEILIVDDNGYNVMVLRMIVESLGIKADTAKSGDEAISNVVKKLSESKSCNCILYFVILMDIDMPEKDGIATTIEILEIFETLKVSLRPIIIACTAFHESEYGERCLRAGMKDFITKPIKRDLLEKILSKHLSSFI